MRITDPVGTYAYVIKAERGKPEATTFQLRVLTARELAELEDGLLHHQTDGAYVIKSGMQSVRALALGLRGWSDLLNAAGQAVTFQRTPTGGPTDEMLDLLPVAVRRELAEAILSGSTLTDEQAKNSASGPG